MKKSWRNVVGLGARAAMIALAVTGMAASCVGGTGGGDESDPVDPPGPVDGDPTKWNPNGETGECNVDALLKAPSYASKVKALLTGMPLEAEELDAVVADPGALPGLIDGWLETDGARQMFERFFMTAFQQTGLDNESFFYPLGFNNTAMGRFTNPQSETTDVMLNDNFAESFARTAYEIMHGGEPWTRVIDTDTFMMTTAQMVYLAFQDDHVVADDESKSLRTTDGDFPTLRFVTDESAAPPASQALDPNHANFGKFWQARLVELPGSCNVTATNTADTTKFTAGEWRIQSGAMKPSFWVFSALFGRHQSISRHQTTGCNTGASNKTPLLDRNDFSDWRPVKIRQPGQGESASIFYDLDGLRSSGELVLHMPRPGFIGSPGFVGTWPSNEDNAARVVINQILIVALGASFEGVAVTDFTPTNIDAEHAADSECYSCHQTLDPMKAYVQGTYTNFGGHQLDPERADMAADFVFGNVKTSGAGITDLTEVLKSHPYFPRAWAQKLCYYANSGPCPESEELDRVVAAFVDSGHDFRVLVRELFSSPLVTGEACVAGVDAGTTATIARRSQFCNQLSVRLGVDDICALRTDNRSASNLQRAVRDATVSIPDDGFSRAVVEPVTIAETGMFTRANREAACNLAALNAWDTVFADLDQTQVLPILAEQVMNLPSSDARHDAALAVLEEHVADAVAGGATEKVGMQSAFVVACMSPGSAGVGF